MSLYIPPHFASQDRATAVRLLHEFPFAMLVTPGEARALFTHEAASTRH